MIEQSPLANITTVRSTAGKDPVSDAATSAAEGHEIASATVLNL